VEGQVWRFDVSEARRLKALEDENARVKKLPAESMLNESALRDLLGKNGRARRKAIGTRAPVLVEAIPNARWSLDFMHDQLDNGRRFRVLNIVDDVTRECLAAVPDTSISGVRVVRELAALVARHGKPMQNGICEAFNSKMRDELLNETLFFGLDQARSVVARWVDGYNRNRPHSALSYQTPATFAVQLTAMGDRLRASDRLRRSPIASPALLRQSQQRAPGSAG